MKKHVLIPAALTGLTLLAAENPYANPALNPVTFEKPVSRNRIELVKDGELQFAIVCDLAAEAGKAAKEKFIVKVRKSATLAAEGIQHAFASATGKKPVILKPDSPKLEQYHYWIVLGDNPITRKHGLDPSKLEPEEFKVFTFDRGIIIAGHDGSRTDYYNALDVPRIRVNGTAHGAFDFCERFVGMRYYYPKIGIYAPKVKNLTVDPVCYRDKPFLKYHNSYALGPKNIPGKQQLSEFGAAWRNGASTRVFIAHTPQARPLAAAYPDKKDLLFFRSKSGNLYYNPQAHMGNYFDVTNPAFIDFFVDELVAKFYAGDPKVKAAWGRFVPNSEYVGFGQCDTFLADLENERSKPYIVESRKNLRTGCLSDVYAHFNIELAKKLKQRFPDKKLVTSAYSTRTLPPVRKYDWPDNLRMLICMGCPVMTPSPAYRKAWKNVFSEWRRITGRPVGNYCYGVGLYAITAGIQGRYMGEFIKLLGDDLWKEFIFFDAGHDNHFYYSYYPAYRAMWNPGFNAQAALDEHWPLLYGPEAGKHLKEFYDLLVTTWEKKAVPQIKTVTEAAAMRGNITPRQLYTAFDLKTIDKLDSLLKKAKKAVKPGSIEAQRLNYFLEPWKKQLVTARAYHQIQTPVYKVARLNPQEKIQIDGSGNDPAWQRAELCELRECQGNEYKFQEKPAVRMMWNDQGIYLLFTALKKPLVNPGKIFRVSDSWEFMVSPGLKKQYHYQFAFNPVGDLYQAQRDAVDGVGGQLNCPGLVVKSKYDDNGWTAEMFVPFSGLRQKQPAPYSVWFGNVVYGQHRTSFGYQDMFASFALTMRNNQNMDQWGQFKFMGYGD
ncbi:MAG: DUF4838 domain-containing protein [Lentisphaerae bacterium]|nr:DUF4838 domain-containing protein [Lentisphaerota bacterium]